MAFQTHDYKKTIIIWKSVLALVKLFQYVYLKLNGPQIQIHIHTCMPLAKWSFI